MAPTKKHRFKTEEDVKKALVASTRKEVKELVWELLVHDLYVQECLDGEDGAWEGLIKRHNLLDSMIEDSPTKEKKPKPVKREISPDKRLIALSRINAIEASRIPDVATFRDEVLGGQLLDLEDVPAWIERQAEKDGKITKWVWVKVKAPLPAETVEALSDKQRLLELARSSLDGKHDFALEGLDDILAYPVPNEPANRVYVNMAGILGRLKGVTKTLIKSYPWWQEAQAVAFILCGVIPPHSKGKGQISFSSARPPRIRLDLDPRLSSQEVAKFYASLRQVVFPGRDRDMGDKHLELAVFLAEYPTGRTWPELMEVWNREKKKEWAYNDFRWFARDARSAWERVTGKDWVHRPTNKGGRN